MENNNQNLASIAENIINPKQLVRGEGLITKIKYIKNNLGEEAVAAVQKKIKELNLDLDIYKIKSLDWYPEGYNVLLLLIYKEIFNFKDEDIIKVGRQSPPSSFIVKLMLRYFISMKKTFKNIPEYWRKHFNFGELKPILFDDENKKMIFQIFNFPMRPTMQKYFIGYFSSLVELIIGSKVIDAVINEQREGNYFEVVIKW